MTIPLSPAGRARRSWVGAALLGPALGAVPGTALAGRQAEEPLADSVRSVLSAAIANHAPPRPTFLTIEQRLDYLRWLGAMSDRMKRYVADHVTRVEFLQTLWY